MFLAHKLPRDFACAGLVSHNSMYAEPGTEKILTKYLKETGCGDVIEKGLHLFKLHDFGFRGFPLWNLQQPVEQVIW